MVESIESAARAITVRFIGQSSSPELAALRLDHYEENHNARIVHGPSWPARTNVWRVITRHWRNVRLRHPQTRAQGPRRIVSPRPWAFGRDRMMQQMRVGAMALCATLAGCAGSPIGDTI